MSYSIPSAANSATLPAIKVCNTCQSNREISFTISTRSPLLINKSNNPFKIRKEAYIGPISRAEDSGGQGYSMSFDLCKGVHLVRLNPGEQLLSISVCHSCNVCSCSIPCCIHKNINVCFHIMRAFFKGYNGSRTSTSMKLLNFNTYAPNARIDSSSW